MENQGMSNINSTTTTGRPIKFDNHLVWTVVLASMRDHYNRYLLYRNVHFDISIEAAMLAASIYVKRKVIVCFSSDERPIRLSVLSKTTVHIRLDKNSTFVFPWVLCFHGFSRD